MLIEWKKNILQIFQNEFFHATRIIEVFNIYNDEIKIKNCIKKENDEEEVKEVFLSNIYQNFYCLIIFFY